MRTLNNFGNFSRMSIRCDAIWKHRLEKKSANPYSAPEWIHYGGILMPTHLSIKNAPDAIVRRLKERAERHHRSLQGELLSILEEAVSQDTFLTPDEVLRKVSALKLSTPSESAQMIRADRDAR